MDSSLIETRRRRIWGFIIGLGTLFVLAGIISLQGTLGKSPTSIEQRRLVQDSRVKVLVSKNWDMDQRELQLQAHLDGVLVFQHYNHVDVSSIKAWLKTGYRVILCFEMDGPGTSLATITAGQYDEYLIALGEEMGNLVEGGDGRELVMRILHEPNGDWYPWGSYVNVGSGPPNTQGFKDAWKHCVDLLNQYGTNFKYQLNFNRANKGFDTTPFSEWYPGDDYVDSVALSGYNRASIDYDAWRSFKDIFWPAYNSAAAMCNKPISIAETSTGSVAGQSKPQWFIDAFAALVHDFPRITEATFFLQNKETDWDLNTQDDVVGFRTGLRSMRSAFGCDTDMCKWDGTPTGGGGSHTSPTPTPDGNTPSPTPAPTPAPEVPSEGDNTPSPTPSPAVEDTPDPTPSPTLEPTPSPTLEPTPSPTIEPTQATPQPTPAVTVVLTEAPSNADPGGLGNTGGDGGVDATVDFPTAAPTFAPTIAPSMAPSYAPTVSPTFSPTLAPTFDSTA